MRLFTSSPIYCLVQYKKWKSCSDFFLQWRKIVHREVSLSSLSRHGIKIANFCSVPIQLLLEGVDERTGICGCTMLLNYWTVKDYGMYSRIFLGFLEILNWCLFIQTPAPAFPAISRHLFIEWYSLCLHCWC